MHQIHKHPLFFPAIYFATGLFLHLHFLSTLLVLPVLFLIARHYSYSWLLFLCLGSLYGQLRLVVPTKTVSGHVVFTVDESSPARWGGTLFKGTIAQITNGSTTVAKNLPGYFTSKKKIKNTYKIEGQATLRYNGKKHKLEIKDPVFLQKENPIKKIRSSFQKRACSFLKKRFPSPRVYRFFQAAFVGKKPPDMMNWQFRQAGLMHILAISGFHFGLIAFALHFLLQKLFQLKTVAILQILLMTLYVLFLGYSPSSFRAYLMGSLFYGGILLKRRSFILNSLCVPLWIELLFNPYVITNLGAQLSYLITIALIVFYPSISSYLLDGIGLPKEFIKWDRPLVWILRTFYQTLALSLCAYLISAPFCLYYFQELSLLGFIYNFFMPQLLGLCMITAMISWPTLYISQWVDIAAQHILDLIAFYPHLLDMKLHISIPGWSLGLFLSGLLWYGVYPRFLREDPLRHLKSIT